MHYYPISYNIACGNGGPHNPAWIQSFFEQGGAEVLDIITYHWYGQPSTDENLPATVLTTEFMEAEIAKTKQTRDDFTAWAPGLRLWLGEGAMSALSGQHGLTDRFEDTLWYVVRLGALAANGHSGWQRQTLLGGYYSLVDVRSLFSILFLSFYLLVVSQWTRFLYNSISIIIILVLVLVSSFEYPLILFLLFDRKTLQQLLFPARNASSSSKLVGSCLTQTFDGYLCIEYDDDLGIRCLFLCALYAHHQYWHNDSYYCSWWWCSHRSARQHWTFRTEYCV